MTKFAYNNTKNASTYYILFKLNYGYHPRVLFVEDVNSCSKSRFADKLAEDLRELIEVYCQNQLHA